MRPRWFVFTLLLVLLVANTNVASAREHVVDQTKLLIMYADPEPVPGRGNPDCLRGASVAKNGQRETVSYKCGKVTFSTYHPATQNVRQMYQDIAYTFMTGVVSKDEQTLYYTAKVGRECSGAGESVAMHRVPATGARSGSGQPLTKRVFNVDYMRVDATDSKVFMRAVQCGRKNSQLATYDVQAKKVTFWDNQNTDREVHQFDYSPVTNQLLVVSYSLNQEVALMELANEQQKPIKPPTYQVSLYSSTGEKIKDVTEIKEHILHVSIAPTGKMALLTVANPYGPEAKHSIYALNLENGGLFKVFEETDAYRKINHAHYATNMNKIYFTAVRKDAQPLQGKWYLSKPRILCSVQVHGKTTSGSGISGNVKEEFPVRPEDRNKGTITDVVDLP